MGIFSGEQLCTNISFILNFAVYVKYNYLVIMHDYMAIYFPFP